MAARSLMDRLAELATLSDEPGGLTRLFLSPAHEAAAAMVQGFMREAGLDASVDAIGNVVGRTRHAPADAPVLLLGSHIDTVRNAGWYDGNFGVLAAIEAVRAVGPLPYNVEIIAFGDEEGVRFPATLAGSRAVAGRFDPATLALRDEAGTSLAEALRDFGCDPDGISAVARRPDRVCAYVELHIEQGPVLEARDLPLGIVTAINGANRLSITVTGAAGHAGTVPMALRHDALTAAAEMILAIEELALRQPDLVATVGRLAVLPGAPNSIPGSVTFSVDIRAPEDAVRTAALSGISARLESIAAGRAVALSINRTHDAAATPCAPWLQAQFAEAIGQLGISPFHLPSGAGHDAMAVASLCPVGMLFVRCKGGISHTPEESITAEDAALAVAALTGFLQNFKPPS
jgi:hydantoinase/carbamoylase family amidase